MFLFIGSLGPTETILIVLVILLLFGGRKIPELMRGLGRGVREFNDAKNNVRKEIEDSVNEKENYWNCFSGCGGGSVVDFWMKMNNMDFKEAVNDLAERLGVK